MSKVAIEGSNYQLQVIQPVARRTSTDTEELIDERGRACDESERGRACDERGRACDPAINERGRACDPAINVWVIYPANHLL